MAWPKGRPNNPPNRNARLAHRRNGYLNECHAADASPQGKVKAQEGTRDPRPASWLAMATLELEETVLCVVAMAEMGTGGGLHYEIGTPLPTPTGPRKRTTAQLSRAQAERNELCSRRPKARVYYTDLTGI